VSSKEEEYTKFIVTIPDLGLDLEIEDTKKDSMLKTLENFSSSKLKRRENSRRALLSNKFKSEESKQAQGPLCFNEINLDIPSDKGLTIIASHRLIRPV
jgi:hypothetical protein